MSVNKATSDQVARAAIFCLGLIILGLGVSLGIAVSAWAFLILLGLLALPVLLYAVTKRWSGQARPSTTQD